MGWGDDSFKGGTFGNSGWKRCHSNEDPEGQHLNNCQAPSTKTYDEHCPGCRYDRAMGRQNSTSSSSSELEIGLQVVTGKSEKSKSAETGKATFFSSTRPTKLAQRSLWD